MAQSSAHEVSLIFKLLEQKIGFHTSFYFDSQLKCCGVADPSDWLKSAWYKSTGEKAKEKYPESCCKTKGEKCNVGDNPDNYKEVSVKGVKC